MNEENIIEKVICDKCGNEEETFVCFLTIAPYKLTNTKYNLAFKEVPLSLHLCENCHFSLLKYLKKQ